MISREDVIKPTPTELGIDPDRLAWERSGEADGSIEVAFPAGPDWARGDWVLMRVVGDANARVLVFDRNEWACFLDGVRKGEFDHAAELASGIGRAARPDTTCGDLPAFTEEILNGPVKTP